MNAWQRLVEHFAAYPGSVCMSDRHLAEKCHTTNKVVQSIKKQMRAERKGQIPLLYSVYEEISKIQSIPRCAMCSRPLSELPTENITLVNDFNYSSPQEVHTSCVDGYVDEMIWKIKLFHQIIKKVVA